MTPSWFRLFAKKLRPRPTLPIRNRKRFRPQLEQVEDRVTPATITWISTASSGAWLTASNWDLGRVPAPGDDVVIPDKGTVGPSITVTLASNSTVAASVRSITTQENFIVSIITGGAVSLAVTDTIDSTASVTVTGTASLTAGGKVSANNLIVSNGTLTTAADIAVTTDLSLQLFGRIDTPGAVSVGDDFIIQNNSVLANATVAAGTKPLTTPANGLLTLDHVILNRNLTVPSGATATVQGGTVINAGVGLSSGPSKLTVKDSLVLNAALTVNQGAAVQFDAAAAADQQVTTTSSGVVVLDARLSNGTALRQTGVGHTVTFGPNVTLTTTTGISATTTVNTIGDTTGGGLAGTWVNRGTWSVQSEQELTFGATGTFRNEAGGQWVTNTGGILNVAGNWSNAGTVQVSGGTLNLGGAFASAGIGAIARTGGTVTITGVLTGDLTLVPAVGSWLYGGGGSIIGGTITVDPAVTFTQSGNFTFDATRVATGSTVYATSTGTPILTVQNGFTIDGILQVGNAAGTNGGLVSAAGTQTIDGTGSILFTANTANTIRVAGAGNTLTFGPDLWIRGRSARIRGGANESSQNALVVQAKVQPDVAGGTFSLGTFATSFTTTGLVQGLSGSTLSIAGDAWTNTGSVTLPTGSTFTVGPTAWSNTGTIDVTGTTVTMGGTFPGTSVDPGRFTRSGGTVNLTGTVTGGLTLTDPLGNWNFAGGTLSGGTFVRTGSANLIATATGGTLNAVTLASPIDLTTNSNNIVQVTGGLTVNTDQPLGARAGGSSQLRFNGTQTLTGSGSLVFGTAAGGSGNLTLQSSTNTLTIAPGFTLRGTTLYLAGGPIVNRGTIRRDEGAGSFNVNLGPAGRNEGLIETTATSLDPGSRTFITAGSGGTWTNLGNIRSSGVTIVGFQADEKWTNLGTIEATAGSLEFRGLITQAKIGAFTRTAAATVTIGLSATLSGDLTLDDTTGTWELNNAGLTDGTLRTAGAAVLLARSGDNTFTRYTVAGTLDLAQASTNFLTVGGLTLAGGTVLAGGGSATAFLDVRDNQTWGGTGTIVFGSAAGNTISSRNGNKSLTIGEGVTVRGHTATFNMNTALSAVTNLGTIAADVNGGTIVIGTRASTFVNRGTVRAANGGTVLVPGDSSANLTGVTNVGNVYYATLNGGRWDVGASSSLGFMFGDATTVKYLRLTTLAADVRLDGGLSNVSSWQSSTVQTDALTALTAVSGDGALSLTGGRSFTPIGMFVANGGLTVGVGSTLTAGFGVQSGGGLTVNGSILGNITVTGGTVHGSGELTGNLIQTGGVLAPGNSPGVLDIVGDYALEAGGVLELEIAGRRASDPVEYDQVRVTGTATLAGAVRVAYLDEFQPTPGDEFVVVSAGTLAPTVAATQFPGSGGIGRRLLDVYSATTLTLQAQQLPPVELGFVTELDSFNVFPHAITTDGYGYSYVTGFFYYNVDFDGGGPTERVDITPDFSATYIAKYDPDGGLVWVRVLRQDGGSTPQGFGVAVDTSPGGNGDVIFGGTFGGGSGPVTQKGVISDGTTTLTFNAETYTGGGGVGFVVRLSAEGVPLWGRAIDGNSFVQGLAVGPTGTVYITGFGTGDFDPGPGMANVSGDFAWALDRAGQYVAVATLAGGGSGIAVSAADDVWVTGSTNASGNADIVVHKVRLNGTTFDTLLTQTFGAAGDDYGTSIAVDASGNVVVGGQFNLAVDFDASPTGAFTLPSNGDSDGFLLALTADGTFRWARAVGGPLADFVSSVSTDTVGNVSFSGLFDDTVDFDPGEENYLLTNNSTEYFGSPVRSGYVAQYDANGNFTWALPINGSYFSEGPDVAADGAGRLFVHGRNGYFTDYDPGEDTYTLSTFGAFVWRLNQKGRPVAAISGLPTGTLPVEGDTLSVAAVVTDTDSDFFTYAWVVTRDGVQVATGAGPVLTVSLADQGTYAVTLTVTDDTGNRTTAAGSVAVSNAVPRLNATAFGPATQPAFNQPDILAAGEGQGASLAVGPDAVLVGSPTFAAGGLANAGRAALYFPGGFPFYNPFVTSPAPQADARFGASVAVVGNYYVVAAPGQNAGSGAVFVFDSFGQWVRTLAGAAAGDRFGTAVAAVGGFVVVGAPGRTADTGVAYLFDPATGRLVQTFRNPTPAVGDEFGSALVAVGGGVLIGSPGDDSVGLDAGAAYLFDTGTGRVVRDLFNPFPSAVGGRFGSVLAASGTVAAVGVPADDSAGADAGGVHLYDLDPTTAGYGSLVGTVRSPSAEAVGSKFGSSVSLRGNRLLVGAPAEAGNSGRAYLFDSDPRSATYGQSLRTFATEFPTADDRFGAAVGIAGDNVFVGAPGFDAPGVVPDPPRPDAGQAFAFLATAFVTQSATAVTEGDAVTVSGSFTDAGAGDGHVATITWGNGASTRVRLAAGEYAFTATYRYVDDDPTGTASDDYPVRVAVQDLTPDLLVNYINPLGADVLSRADGTTGAAVPDFFYSDFLGGYGDQTGLRVGPDGLIYISTRAEGGGGDGPVYRLDPTTAGVIDEFIPSVSETDQTVNNLAFDPAGRLVRFDPTVGYFVRYDGATGAVVPAQYADLGAFNSTDPTDGQVQDFVPQGFAYGPDGDLYVANFYSIDHITSGILRFDGEFGDYLGLVPGSASLGLINPTELAFGPDGALYVSSDGGSGRQVWQLDRTTGRRVRTFEVGTPVSGRDDFLVDADYLYWSSPNEGTRRFSLATGESLGQFGGGLGGFLALLAPTDFTAGPITVSNAAPDARVVAAPNGTPGEYTLTALVEDAGTADTLTYSWTITGGTPVGPTDTADFSFAAAEGTSLTVTLTVTDDDGGTVTGTDRIIIGTDAADTITVTDPGDAGRVIVYGLGGDDRLNAAAATVPVELIGGFGDDTLVGGTNADLLTGNNVGDYDLFNPYDGDTGADSLVAGAGNDTLDGGLGDDTMDGGGGNDLFLEVPGSDDLLVDTAATGTDTVDYRYAFHGVKFTLAIADGTPQVVNPTAPVYEQHTVALLGNFENLTGSGYDDDLSGTAGDNDLRGGGGDDLLFGGGPAGLGSTVLGDGNDSLSGGAGNDTVLGGSGNDILFGGTAVGAVAGADDDSLVGGSGSDTVVGGTGNDILFGGDLGIVVGPVLAGGADADSLVGGAGNDTVVGGTGNDILFGGDPVAAVVGPDDDSLVGGAGSDTLAGGAGNDILFGGTAVATVAAPGNDSLVGGSGSDTVVGGSGNDILFGGDPLAVVASSIPDDDSLVGGAGNDTLLGGTGNDILFGGEPTATLVAAGNDSLVGGAGNDTVVGGTGNDILFGGDPLGLPATAADDDSLVGGAGNDTVVGGTGNDILFGGLPAADVVGPDNDSLAGGAGNDTVLGGAGNDILFGGEAVLTAPLAGTAAADDDSLVGGTGNDTLLGGAGNDILFGGVAVAGSAVPDADSLLGGLGNDTLSGGAGNDILFGGEGDDRLAGEAGTDRYEGGSGNDTVVEGADADVTLTGTQLVVGGTDPERLYDIDRAVLGGGAGDNYLSAATFFGPVTLVGGGGADTLVGGLAGDSLSGGSGDDSLVGGAGPDRLDPGGGTDLVDGGADNDTYTVALGGADTLVDASGIDFLDLSSTAFALDVDLDRPTVAFDTAGNTLTAVGAVENARGSGYADTIKGSGDRNVLEGGGGADFLDGRAGDDTVQGGFPQIVYLDFDSATGQGERVYAVAERNDIQNRLEKLFAAPFTVTFTQTPPSSGRFATLVVNAGNGEDTEALVGGVSSELDFRNTGGGGRSAVNVNGFLGRKGQPPATPANYVALTTEVLAHELGHLLGLRHSDAFGPLGLDPDTGLPYGVTPGLFARSVARDETAVPLVPTGPAVPGRIDYRLARGPVLLRPIRLAGNTTDTPVLPPTGTVFADGIAVATFTIGTTGTLALMPVAGRAYTVASGSLDPDSGVLSLTWQVPAPATSSVRLTYQYDPLRPGYRGPDDAGETSRHVIASPAALGTSIADALAGPYFGERELIKLAFADAGRTVQTADVPVLAGGVRDLGTLPALAVPNLLPPGTTNSGREIRARAITTVGTLAAGETVTFAVRGNAGDLLTAEVLSESIRQRLGDTLDAVLTVRDSNGNPLDFYGRPAVGDDGIDNRDPILQDVQLPADGVYSVTVRAYSPTDAGGYELFLAVVPPPVPMDDGLPRQGGEGDRLEGGDGRDVLVGAAGDDRFYGTAGYDTFIGATPGVDATDLTNHPPAATVHLSRTRPGTNDVLTATATGADADADAVHFTYVWTVDDGTTVRDVRRVTTLAETDALDLSVPGNGDLGDVIRVTVTPNDGATDGDPAVAEATVFDNAAPVVTSLTLAPGEPTETDPLTATVAATDANDDAIVFEYVWTVDGEDVFRESGSPALTSSLDPAAFPGVFSHGANVTVTVTPFDGTGHGTPASTSVTVGRRPTATVELDTEAPLTNDLLYASAAGDTFNGADIFFTFEWRVNGEIVQTTVTDATADVLDLSQTGFGDTGDTVTVTVTPSDGVLTGPPVTATAVVGDTAPEATVDLNDTAPRTNDVLTATATGSDADGDAITFTYRWYVDDVLEQTTPETTATTDAFDLSAIGHGDHFQIVRVAVTPRAAGADGSEGSEAATVANTPPTAGGTSYLADAGTPLTVAAPGLLAFAADADYDTLTLVDIDDGPAHGSLGWQSDGSFVYTPAAGYVGPDAFAYTVSDGTDTATATVSVTVRSAARAVISGAPPGSVSEGTLVSLTGSVEPAGGSPATFAWTLARNGTPVASGTGTAFAFTPADDGVYLVTLTGTAGGLAVTPATATVTATNVAPTAATVTRSGATLADRVRVTVGLGGVADPSPADTTAGFRYSFATSVAGLATTWAGGQLTATATLDFARAAAVHTVYLRVLDDDDGFTDRTVRVVVGSDGADTLAGTAGVDVLFGLGGTDSLVGGGGDFLDGGAGTDTLVASAGGDQLVGGDGADSLFGGAGDDLLDGGAGADTLRAGAGDDVLGGGADADWLYAGAGADQLYGDAGADRLVGGPSPALLDGGADADTLSAGGAGDTLAGGDGTDSLVGGAGADSLLGGAGADRLDGGAGTDTLAGGSDADTLVGGAGADRLNGDDGDDVFWGWGGVFVDDTLAGGAGGDRVQNPGTAGGLTLAGFSPAWGVEQIAGAAGVGTQYVAGTAAAEVFDFAGVALTGIGYVDAGDGADRVVAGVTPGVEYRGGAGDDTLESGAGADKLTGGAGTDLFRMAASGGEDRVADFRRGQDRLDLRPLGVTGSQVSWVRSGADTLVTVQAPAGAFVVRLVAYTGTLDVTDFLFV